jgi:hypothetical protein
VPRSEPAGFRLRLQEAKDNRIEGYVPVLDSNGTGIIGFGWVTAGSPGLTDSTPYPVPITLKRMPGRIAPENASATLLGGNWPATGGPHWTFKNALLAPLLVR